MFDARNDYSLPTAFAGGTVARADGGVPGMWVPDLAHCIAPFSIHRGVKQ